MQAQTNPRRKKPGRKSTRRDAICKQRSTKKRRKAIQRKYQAYIPKSKASMHPAWLRGEKKKGSTQQNPKVIKARSKKRKELDPP